MINRIQLILKTMNLSPSQFADEIQVQRSSISHILSGRNKPSLDFVMKILATFPEVDSDWLIFGKGQMIKQKKSEIIKSESEKEKNKENEIIVDKDDIKIEKSKPELPHTKNQLAENFELIEKIVVFFKDRTFKEYVAK